MNAEIRTCLKTKMTVENEEIKAVLEHLRVLDLTDETGFFCGRLLGDMGADVIKIEKPGGEAARNIGPFYHDRPDSEASLYWFAYNMNKRGITLDINTHDGQDIFRKLVKTANVIVESFAPGYMPSLGLGYADIAKIKPSIIMVSITPFGQDGPYQAYKTCDLVSMAMGGLMYTTGTPDRPPLRIGVPQSFVIAGASAAMATMVAYYWREGSGEGQHVDVSIQASVASALANLVPLWELNRFNQKRQGSYLVGRTSGTRQRTLWPCKDGYVTFHIIGASFGRKTNEGITKWMASEGMAPDFMTQIDWNTFDMLAIDQEFQDRLEEPIGRFFLTHTKAELYKEALDRGIMVFPVCNAQDIVENPQLQARGFWLQVEDPVEGAGLTCPGFFVKASETPCTLQRCAPRIGGHNQEIYEGELGFSREEISRLRQANVI